MKRTLLMLAGCGVVWTQLAWPVRAAEPAAPVQAEVTAEVQPNAAVIYWTAFAALPTITQEQREKMTAAAKATSEPIPDEVRATLPQYETALHEMHRAVQCEACDWQLDYTAGPHLRLPHLQHARDLAWVALVRARVRFAAGENEAAVNDVLDVLRMGRDCGRSPVIISMLVDVAIERLTFEVLAGHLSQLTPDQLSQLPQRLQALPPTATAAEGFRKESEMFGGWVGRRIEAEAAKINDPKAGAQILGAIQKEDLLGDDLTTGTDADAKRRREVVQSLTLEELRSAVHRLHSDYEEMAKIAELPFAERGAKFAAFQAGLDQSRKLANRDDLVRSLSIQFLPSYQMVSLRMKELHVRRALLDLAIQVQLHGPDALKSALIHGTTVEHHQTAAGFELRYQIPGSDKAETLRIPSKK